jgi:1-acyl-sn-glycerol-3-phosphate acyltransferase
VRGGVFHRLLARGVRAQMRGDMRGHFRRILWDGPLPDLPPGRPLVAYANHTGFYDGHLVWLLLNDHLGREPLVWMAEWDRFPIFGLAGAQPFPEGDPKARFATVRRTARRMRERPETAMIYFPEGTIHPPEDGLIGWPEDAFDRLARLLPEPLWWPVAVHYTWEGDPRPTAILAGGEASEAHEGAREHLERLWLRLRASAPRVLSSPHTTVLLEGPPGPHERWDLSLLARPLRRFL